MDWPSRLTERFTEISLKRANSPPILPSLLSKISSTVAWLTGLRVEEPEKMTSVSASPRRREAELSPITQRMASMMLDLPQPFGPTMPVMFVGRWKTVGSTKDLKPDSLMVERRMDVVFGLRSRRDGTGSAAGLEFSLNAGDKFMIYICLSAK